MVPSDPVVVTQNLEKQYAGVKAVEGVSFEVNSGEIFGLLGPNGAGKTTTIRMILNLISPTAGEVSVLGGDMTEEKKQRIGYLPEERGLYNDMTLLDMMLFLGQLKGLDRKTALDRVEHYLGRVDLWDARTRKIEALSRGMRQKAQFVAAVLHEPELLIVDEPFSGLDPVNTRIIKSLLYELQENGASIIMSTHQMSRVEEMCERILLMDHGHQVLYGDLEEVRRSYDSHAVLVWAKGQVDNLKGVEQIEDHNGAYRLALANDVRVEDVLVELASRSDVEIIKFERALPSLEEIFIQVVGGVTQVKNE